MTNPLLRFGSYLRGGETDTDNHEMYLTGGRDADVFYRDRWAYDKVVRSTHGVNCTGSCSWKVYVKDGVITWESQQTDYPTTGPNIPEYEPRGCPRGAAFSWYTYSPTRIRYPYVRAQLIDMYRDAKKRLKDPVLAWRDIVEDPLKAKAYKSARGKGGMIRVDYEEALEIAAPAHLYTVREYGPDRVAGFSVIPAMSMISYGAGARFLQLIGGVNLSFYDWYADLPPASPQMYGDQTDVPESGDWYNSTYLIMWGSNIPLTRTPDAHFMVEARYSGQKVVVVSPDFADNTKFADEWLRANPGTDGALAMAMGHVILNEFHVKEQTPYFLDYMKRFTDSPFLVELDRYEEEAGSSTTFVPGKFLTAAELNDEQLVSSANAEHRLLVMDKSGHVVDPGGTVADRWGDEGKGKWNLSLDGVDPIMSVGELEGHGTAEILLPRFDLPNQGNSDGPIGAGVLLRGVPTYEVDGKLVTTVFDILLANYSVNRPELGLPGQWPTGYDDLTCYGAPAWQEELTGVPMEGAIRVAREFARNAEESHGRSMIVMGAGTNHYFHSDEIYRTFLALTTMCGTQGVNGGGWAHYVGQEKLRPQTGWAQYTFALDWQRPARQMISTGFWYLTTDQWRYDNARTNRFASPLATDLDDHELTSDTLVESMKRGWMPCYPQFTRNTLKLSEEAKEKGIAPKDYIADELRSGNLKFSCEDPDAREASPKILLNWRTNLMGSSAKGTEFFLRHMLGVDSDATATELAPEDRPRSIVWHDEAPQGKLDLMMTSDFRNTSTTLVSDIIFPAATWYEKHDMSSTDMHPFLHTFNEAITPPWEARTDFELFQDLAGKFSEYATTWLGTQTDVVTVPFGHDSPDELGSPRGIVTDLDSSPLPKMVEIERDYSKVLEKFNALGPLSAKAGMNTKGVALHPDKEVEELAQMNGTVETSIGPRPSVATDKKACEAVLRLSGTSNGRLATQGFAFMDERVGSDKPMKDLSIEEEGKRITWKDISEKPVGVITSPEWSGSEHGGRRYTAFAINVEHDKPWHTLSGRMHYYLDHDWMIRYGEALPTFKPPVDVHQLYGETAPGTTTDAEVTVRYLTPHNKWAIHSQYFDNLHVLSLARGGQVMWMSNKDAEKIGVKDNDWIEAKNRNGIVSARAVVSHRIPEGTVFMHHASERTVGTPVNEKTGRRGGTHNSLTRIMIKPTHLIGGYGQFTYSFNYIGPTGNNRDEVTTIRRRSQEVEY